LHTYPAGDHYTDTYPVLGTYVATVTASNEVNQVTAHTTVTVINSDPVVDTSGLDLVVLEDEIFWSGYIYFADPNQPDSHTATIDWGDGTTTAPEGWLQIETGGRLWGSHTYADPGVYTATVNVRDQYGGSGIGTFVVTVLQNAMRYCVYAGGAQSFSRMCVDPECSQSYGVTIHPGAIIDCGWRDPEWHAGGIYGGVGSLAPIEVHRAATITGNLVSEQGSVSLGKDAHLFDSDLCYAGHIKAEGNISLLPRSSVGRDVTGRSHVELGSQSAVGGDIVAAGSVEIAADATVSGTVTEGADVPPIAQSTPVSFSFASGTEDVTVLPHASLAAMARSRSEPWAPCNWHQDTMHLRQSQPTSVLESSSTWQMAQSWSTSYRPSGWDTPTR
jgi:hypothetical protein